MPKNLPKPAENKDLFVEQIDQKDTLDGEFLNLKLIIS
jgi:hypothetical protein